MNGVEHHKDALSDAQKQIYAGAFEPALTVLDGVLNTAPKHADALYMKAVCHRYLLQFDEAAAALSTLKSAAPDFGRAYQEEGHLKRARDDQRGALAAYGVAVQLNPALEGAWRAQADLLAQAGRRDDAARAAAQADYWKRQPKEVAAVANLLHEGRLLRAEKLCRAFLQKNPTHVEAMRLLAEIATHFSVFDDAEFLLESAIEFEPQNLRVQLDHIKVLRKRQKFDAAEAASKSLYDRNPDDPVLQSQYAVDSMHVGNFERAFDLFDAVLERLPSDASTLVSRGHALKTYGRQDDAIASYRDAYRSNPGLGDAYHGLANLKTYQFTDEEIQLMKEQEARGDISHNARTQLCFSLGKALEDNEEYDLSFDYYERGNDLKRRLSRYDADQMTEELRLQAEICTQALFEKKAGMGFGAPDPIFILGLPRAGSTLLEQILASHSQVDGTLELPNILAMAHRLRRGKKPGAGSLYPGVLHDLSGDDLSALGEKFIDDTQIHRQGALYFIDKMPNNFRHVGLIHLIMPNAKIIDARRAPMDCCFSGFKQLFAEGQEFTYGLKEIGQYYRDYVDLMRHWDSVLPGRILRVQHEDVLDDLEGEVRRILEYCGLPFEGACLDFHKTKRSVRTASSEQVRKPINRAGVNQWRPYEPHLAPLKDALGPALEGYKDP